MLLIVRRLIGNKIVKYPVWAKPLKYRFVSVIALESFGKHEVTRKKILQFFVDSIEHILAALNEAFGTSHCATSKSLPKLSMFLLLS